jgi:hypothetical protein
MRVGDDKIEARGIDVGVGRRDLEALAPRPVEQLLDGRRNGDRRGTGSGGLRHR